MGQGSGLSSRQDEDAEVAGQGAANLLVLESIP